MAIKLVAGLLATVVAIATFLFMAFILVYTMSCIREATIKAEFLFLLFLNVLSIAVGFGGLAAAFALPYFAGRRVYAFFLS